MNKKRIITLSSLLIVVGAVATMPAYAVLDNSSEKNTTDTTNIVEKTNTSNESNLKEFNGPPIIAEKPAIDPSQNINYDQIGWDNPDPSNPYATLKNGERDEPTDEEHLANKEWNIDNGYSVDNGYVTSEPSISEPAPQSEPVQTIEPVSPIGEEPTPTNTVIE